MRLTFFCLLFLSLTFNLQAQTANRALLQDLLDLPAPPPVTSNEETKIKEYPTEFYDKKNVPPDDAPIEDLLAYWARQNSLNGNITYNIKPSEIVAQRLLEACEKNPEIITEYLKVLPADAQTIDLVRKLYDDEELGKKNEDYWRAQLKSWLKYNSNVYSSDLVKKAQEIKDENEYVTNQEELLALGKVDWENAKPIVERLYNDQTQPVSSTLARWVLYQHALDTKDKSDEEKYRDELKTIVEDRKTSPGKRDLAMDALMQTDDWDGRDNWYLTLLDDETLFELKVNGSVYTGLTTLIRRSPPEKWIPQMVKLVGSSNRAAHRAAVRNLAELLGENRKDVVEALLPWLENPKWAEEVSGERARLIQSLLSVDVPESVPGLIQVVMNEDESFRSMAAQALAKYKNPQAIQALNYALSKEKSEGFRTNIIAALIACGGIPDDEQMLALEAYAARISTPEGLEKLQEIYNAGIDAPEALLPIQISIGKFLSEQTELSDSLVVRAIERLKILRKTNPATAIVLADIMQKWQGRIIFLEMLKQIGSGKATTETIVSALAKRKMLREKLPIDLPAMREKNGLPHGISATILEEEPEMRGILAQNDVEAQIALLAGARLIRADLPIPVVSKLLLSADKMLALAAERYLEAVDSVEARTLVLARHANEAKILGARTSFVADEKKSFNTALLSELFESVGIYYFGDESFSDIKKQEEKLRTEAKENPDLKSIFAILPDADSGQQIVRVYKDKIVFTYHEDAARYRERTLTPKEYETFYRFLIDSKIDNLSRVAVDCQECSSGEFVMFGRNGGRRVFYRENQEIESPISDLKKIFESFNTGESNLHYWLSDKIKGLEVLLADEKFTARAIWKNGEDFRVLVEDKVKESEILAELDEKDKIENAVEIDEEDYVKKQEILTIQQKRRDAVKYDHYAWRKMENGKLGGITEMPNDAILSPAKLNEIDYSDGEGYEGERENLAANQTRIGDYQVFAGYLEQRGLWKISGGQTPTLIKAGWYFRPIGSTDGKWIIAGKGDETYAQPPSVARINLQTGKEYKINLPPADKFYPIAALPAQNKILLYRAKNEYPTFKNNPSPLAPEYYLLDAATGETQIVKGEFRPLEQQTPRPLQLTGVQNEFWAAIYNEKTKATEIGRYETKTFSFKPVLQIPDIKLSSSDVLIDDKDAKIYFVYEGHLLALPLVK